jgi:hypothetical protein
MVCGRVGAKFSECPQSGCHVGIGNLWASHDVNPRDKWGRVQHIPLGHPVQFSRYFVLISSFIYG